MKIINLLILSVLCVCFSMPQLWLDENSLLVEDEERIIFNLVKRENNYFLEPVIIIMKNQLIPPPELVYGSYNNATKSFAFKYLMEGKKFLPVHLADSNVFVKVAKNPDTTSPITNVSCYQVLFAPVALTGVKIQNNFKSILFTNSKKLCNQNIEIKEAYSGEKSDCLKLFNLSVINKEKSKPGINAKVIDLTKILFGENIFYAGNIRCKEGGIIKKYSVIFENDVITFKKSLYNYHESSARWMNSEFKFLNAFDVDNDGITELLFYYKYNETFGYLIYKRTNKGWYELARGGGGGC